MSIDIWDKYQAQPTTFRVVMVTVSSLLIATMYLGWLPDKTSALHDDFLVATSWSVEHDNASPNTSASPTPSVSPSTSSSPTASAQPESNNDGGLS